MKALAVIASSLVFLAGCVDTTTTYVTGANRVVTIGNATGVTMVRFYASNVNRTTWEEDILGTSVLPSGSSVDINIDDGTGACLFDFKAVFADGDEVIENNFNVCTQSYWTVY